MGGEQQGAARGVGVGVGDEHGVGGAGSIPCALARVASDVGSPRPLTRSATRSVRTRCSASAAVRSNSSTSALTTEARSTVRRSASSSTRRRRGPRCPTGSAGPSRRSPTGRAGVVGEPAGALALADADDRARALPCRPRAGAPARGCSAVSPSELSSTTHPPSRSPRALVMSSTPPPASTSSANRSWAAAARSTPGRVAADLLGAAGLHDRDGCQGGQRAEQGHLVGGEGAGRAVGGEQHPDELVLDSRGCRRSTRGPRRRRHCRWRRCAGTGGRGGSRRSSTACASRRRARPDRRRGDSRTTWNSALPSRRWPA